MMIDEVPTETGPGYTEDPYDSPEERAEGFFVGSVVGLIPILKDSSFCSTAREWHILLAAVNKGFKVKTLENIPDCPPKWTDEKQYWDSPAMIANVLKCQWPGVVAVIGGLVGLKAAGVTIPGVL
jgi:hypothetical protein